MTVIVNATPLIALSRIGKLNLLRSLFHEITTTPEVFAEVAVEQRAGAEDVRAASWITQSQVAPVDVQRYRRGGLSTADASLLALAKERASSLLITDDRRLLERAAEEGLTTVRTGALLIQAKEAGLITNVKEVLDALIAAGFRITRQAYRNVLRNAGEKLR